MSVLAVEKPPVRPALSTPTDVCTYHRGVSILLASCVCSGRAGDGTGEKIVCTRSVMMKAWE